MVVIVDYGMGNLGSIANMLKKIGAAARVTSDIKEIGQAGKLILPGVGAFDQGMINLHGRNLIPVLNAKVLREKTPVLGICLGMQLFTQCSEEGVSPGLGWIKARTVRFQFNGANAGLKIPHMGWNTLTLMKQSKLLRDLPKDSRFYFVHSYHVVCDDPSDELAQATYGLPFTACVQHENIMGAQFHPEKSHRFGWQLLKNFVELN